MVFYLISNYKEEFYAKFADKNIFTNNITEATMIIAYGGDGTFLRALKVGHKYFDNTGKKLTIIPIRNSEVFKRCETHSIDLNIYIKEILLKTPKVFNTLKIQEFNNTVFSEFVLRNKDLRKAIRTNVYINDKLYAKHIIGDGIIICTTLGSTGYFKTVSNTIFQAGIGLGFINTTQRVNHLVVSDDAKITLELVRGDAEIGMDIDKEEIEEGSFINISKDDKSYKVIGYEDFMCGDCRRKRHSSDVYDVFNILG